MSGPDERRKKLEELFLLATELAPDERVGFLVRHCGDDDALRTELEGLLIQDEEGTKDFLRSPVRSDGAAALDGEETIPWLPELVGPYRVLEQVGAGGMGTVWLAEQEAPIRRRVALKLVRRTLDDGRTLERFEAERRVLARMDHPGIARILDAGSEAGRPWFAMEYAPGQPIDVFCDEARLDVDARLALFVQVCDAVQHAHQKGVIHRDIKPGNVLVAEEDGAARGKLIDFGIARAVGGWSGRDARADVAGTFHYMSPEQLDPGSADVDTRSDIYALGSLLYKLLAGTEPFDKTAFEGREPREIAVMLRSAVPEAPSERLARAAARSFGERFAATRRAVLRSVRGDLDTIIATALSADRELRYSSAGALAEDVQRFLASEPLAVGPSRWTYRLRKSVRRNRIAFLSGALVALSLIAGFIGTTRGLVVSSRLRDEAQDEALRSGRITRFLVETLAMADPSVSLDPEASVATLLASATGRIDSAFASDPGAEALIRHTIGKAYQSLGDLGLAERHLHRAIELWEEDPDVTESELYATMWALVLLYDELDTRRGLELGKRADAIRRRLIRRALPGVADALDEVGEYFVTDRYDESIAALARAESIAERALAPRDPLWLVLSDAFGDVGYILATFTNELAALDFLRAGLRIRRRELPPTHPEVATYQRWLISVLTAHGLHGEAETLVRQSIKIYEEALPADHWMALEAQSQLGDCLMRQGERPEAEELLRSSHRSLRATHGLFFRPTLDATHRLLAALAEETPTDEWLELRAELAEGYAFSHVLPQRWETLAAVFGDEHAELLARMDEIHRGLFERSRQNADWQRAAFEETFPIFGEVRALRRELLRDDDPLAVIVVRQLVNWSLIFAESNPGARRAICDDALTVLTPLRERLPHDVADAMYGRGTAALTAGESDQAERLAAEARSLYQTVFGERSEATLLSTLLLARSLSDQGRFDEAEPMVLSTCDDSEGTYGATHPVFQRSVSELVQLYERWERPHEAATWSERLVSLNDR